MSMSSSDLQQKKIVALFYNDGAYPGRMLENAVRSFQQMGFRVAGVIQHDLAREGRSKCDMKLEVLSSGKMIDLSEDRGEAAQGCRIDQHGLAEAAALIDDSFENGSVDLLVINKFGKIESEGGGLRDVIANAVMRDMPAIVGVPMRNVDAWNAFAGDLYERIILDGELLVRWVAARLMSDQNPDFESFQKKLEKIMNEHALRDGFMPEHSLHMDDCRPALKMPDEV